MEQLARSILRYWSEKEKSFVVKEKDLFWFDLLLVKAYNEIEKNPENAKHFPFLEQK